MEKVIIDGKEWRVYDESEEADMFAAIEALATIPYEDHDVAVRTHCDGCGVGCISTDALCFERFCDACLAKIHKFWDEYHEADLPELGELSTVELVDRHRNVLLLEKKWSARDLAVLLSGKYQGVWDSRSESGRIAALFGADYLLVYCAGSSYIQLMLLDRNEELIQDFEEADKKDKCRNGKNL